MSPSRFLPRPRVFALAIAVYSVVPTARATDYYLGALAASQPGTPVSDITALNALTLQAGDRVFFQGGQTFSGTIQLGPQDAGTPTQPIVLTSFGTGRAVISAGTGAAIKIYNTAGLAVSNLDLLGSGKDTNTCSGIDAGAYFPDDTKLDYLHFEQMNISGFHVGVQIWGWYSTSTVAYPGFRDVSLIHLNVFDNCSEGIKSWGTWRANGDGTHFSHSDFYVADCAAYNNRGDPAASSQTGSGIVLSGVIRATVEYCVAHDNGGLGPTTGGGPYGIWVWESSNCVLQNNLVYHQHTSTAVDGGAYDLDGGTSNSVVQYCYSYQNDGPAVGLIQFNNASPLTNNVVRYNISENDCRKTSQGSLYVGQFSSLYGITGANIFGNTCFISTNPLGGNPPAARVENQNLITGVALRNNLFDATHSSALIAGTTSVAKVVYQGNDYWGGAFDLPTFRTGGQELWSGQPVGLRADPQLLAPGAGGAVTDPLNLDLVTAYQVLAGSPLLQAGLDLTALFNLAPGPHDFYGQVLTSSALPIGASGLVATTTSSTSTPTVLVDDEFTGSGGLSGRIPDTTAGVGQAWSVWSGSISVSAGCAGANATVRTAVDVGAADGTLDSTIIFGTSGTGLLLRASDASNYLRATLTTSGATLSTTIGGVTSNLLNVSHAFVLGQSYRVRVVLAGSSITLLVDDATLATLTSTFNQTATRFGLLASNTGARQWDRFVFTSSTPSTSTTTQVTSPTPPPTGTVLVDDEFTGSGVLGGRVPDTVALAGQHWTVFTGSIGVSSGSAVSSNTTRAAIDVGAADGTVASDIELDTGGTGLILRGTDGLNYLRVVLNSSGLTIATTVAGVTTNNTVVTHSFPLGQIYHLSATLSGSSVVVSVDGVVLASVTTTFNQSATLFGLLASNTGPRQWADFLFTN